MESLINSFVITEIIFYTAILLGAVYLIAYILKKRNMVTTYSSRLKVKEKISVSYRSTVYLVELDDREFILVESTTKTNLLDVSTFSLNMNSSEKEKILEN